MPPDGPAVGAGDSRARMKRPSPEPAWPIAGGAGAAAAAPAGGAKAYDGCALAPKADAGGATGACTAGVGAVHLRLPNVGAAAAEAAGAAAPKLAEPQAAGVVLVDGPASSLNVADMLAERGVVLTGAAPRRRLSRRGGASSRFMLAGSCALRGEAAGRRC